MQPHNGCIGGGNEKNLYKLKLFLGEANNGARLILCC